MDLELSISLADSPFSTNNNRTEVTNVSDSSPEPSSTIYQYDNYDSGLFENDSESTLTDSSQEVTNLSKEEDFINKNVLSSSCRNPSKGESNLNENQNGRSVVVSEQNTEENESNDRLSLSENEDTEVRHFATNDGRSLIIQTSTQSSRSENKLSRQASLPAPVITNIRIGTPSRRSMSMDQESSPTSEVEYTISVSSQSNVTLQMTTSPSFHEVIGDNETSTYNLKSNSTEINKELNTSTSYPQHEIQVGNQIVKLRTKKPHNRTCSSPPCQSKTEEMKRHSAEISQLRQALEEKIIKQSTPSNRNSYHGSPRETKRPLSAHGYPRLYDSPIRDNKRPCDNRTYNRISQSYTSSPVHWRNNNRNTVHITDPKKLKFLSDGQHRNSDPYVANMYNDYKSTIGSIHHSPQLFHDSYYSEISNRNFNPYINQRPTTPYYDCDGSMVSQYNTPRGSPGPSSFRSSKNRTSNADSSAKSGPTVEEDGRINYYPNCDAAIWLRSCQKEITEPLSGEQIGQVPLWLAGTLIRNGPGRLEVGEHKYNHLFDGSALLHRFHFHKGKVTYQNKFLRSRSYLRDTKAQRIVVNYFGTRAHPDPCRTILQNIASKFDFEEHFTDNAQISLYPYGDGLYALTETPFIFRIDPETLNTHEKVDLTKYLAVFTHTAHPHVDRDGTVYNIGQGVGPVGPRYHICKFPNPKKDKRGKTKTPFDQAQIVGSVGARWRLNPCYMHSFAMTENYWIIIEQPLVVSVPRILKVVLRQEALIDALQWWEKETKIHVIRRDTGTTITTQYVTETFFFLHTINAYEDKGHIILDIATYKNAEMLHCMYVDALKNASYDPTYAQMFRGRPKRWAIPLKPNKDASVGTNLVTLPDTKCQGRWMKKNVVYLTPELLSDIGCEVPRIYYEKYNGRPYRYFYAICSDVDHPNPGTLVKVDVVNKTHVEWSEDNVYPSEPVFVPHPLAKNEDDGVVIAALLRARGLDNQVCMLILDAATFTERARVEFVVPGGPVPKCLHGWFVPEGTLKVHTQESTTEGNNSDNEE